jgi:HSP20 family protein
VVKAELPEVKGEDVHVSIENNLLTIRGKRKFSEETKKE